MSSIHELQIGRATIPWTVRYSPVAKRKRIVATPEGVEVVAPAGTPLEGEDGVQAFVQAKRRWIFDTVRQLEVHRSDPLVQYWDSGAKLLYRGRRLRLDVEAADVEQVEVACRSRFNIQVPRAVGANDRPTAVRDALVGWMQARCLKDARRWARRHARRIGIDAPPVRLGDQRTMWGSYGRDGVVRINWRLIQAPVAAMDYVVAHEVCHALERNHGDAFWRLVGQALPDWAERKAMLERWEREQAVVGREV